MSAMTENEIYLYGTVGAQFWDEEHFTPSMVREMLDGKSGPLTVRINSGGGIAMDGQAIYTMLTDYPGEVHVIVDGIAASAASLIAMAGDTVTMRRGAVMMIHDPAQPWPDGRGTEDDYLRTAQWLRVVSNAYADVYALAAGVTREEARAVMKAETYFDGEGAVAAGFATATDEEQAQAVARFDYRIYARAPDELLQAGAAIPRRKSRQAVMAMMAGAVAPNLRGLNMEEEDLNEGAIEVVETEDDAEAQAAEEATGSVAEPEATEDEMEATASAAVAMMDLVIASGRPAEEARDFLARRLTLQQAVAEIAAKKRKENPLTDNLRSGAPTARIVRDERETRREGMAGALVAQMGRVREVTGPARDFMSMGIIDMAAASIGHKGSVRRGAGELRILEMALGSNSTSDFPAIFENALNKRMMAAYRAAEPTYRRISERMDFTDFRPHPVAGVGDFPALLPVGETGEIKFGSTSDKKETVALAPYARGFTISRQMMINDDLGAIDRILSTRGRAVAAFEDAVFYAMMLSGANADGPTLLETTRQVFNTTDTTKAGTAAAITVASLSLGRAAMRKKKGLGKDAADQVDLEISPAIILVGPDKETEAQQLIAPIQAQQAGNVNPFSGTLQIVTSNKISGNAWYLFADPADAPVFMYGYLSGEEGPRMRMEEPFGTQGMAWTVELDFGVGAIDYRGGYKNAGA
jgi:ATP-dependent protease ClpP protease subunit/phage major head subunit gpT-like protein